MPCPADAALAQFIEGTAGDAVRVEIEDHIDRCASCRQTVSATVRRGPAAVSERRLGRYELQAPLGAGAMGVVYAAFDPDLDRRVAVKVLASNADVATRQSRLAREARTLARISHPNVVPVHDVGFADDRLFIAMELVDGDTLRAHVAAHTLTVRQRLELIVQAGRGLAAAHAAGVIHRDFKPDNVFVGRDGRVRVGDFGLAAADVDDSSSNASAVTITRTGALLGTPAYMAPETVAGETATAASDQFALCVTAWEILFGERPFRGTTVAELAEATLQTPADPPDGDRRLAAVLRRGLAVQPAARHRDVTALVDALEHVGQGRRASLWIGGGVALAALGLTGGFVLRGNTTDRVDPCARSDAGVTAVWNPSTQVVLRALFTHSGSPVGSETAETTARAIDHWVNRWSLVSGATCGDRRAELVTGDVYARRARCLQDRADELGALLTVFARADSTTVEHAATAVADLASPEDCKSPPAVASIPPERRADHDLARRLQAEGHALGLAAHYKEAVAMLGRIPGDLRDPALLAVVELDLGVMTSALGDRASARDHLSRAVARADEARDDGLRARALIETLALVGDEDVKLDEAARLQDQARAAVMRGGGSAGLRADLATAIGNVAIRRGKYEDALQSLDEAIEADRARQPLDPIKLATVLNSAAGLRGELGDYAKSLKQSEEARELAVGAVGANHPLTAAILGSMAQSLHFSGRTAEALVAARRSLEIYEHVFGPNHPRVAAVLNNVAVLTSLAKRYDEAIVLFDRSRRITEASLGPDHADNGTNWLNIASAQKDAGHLDLAVAGYVRVIEIWERALGKDHVELARPLVALADVELQRHAPDRALPLLERGVALRTQSNTKPTVLAHTRFLLARALRELGREPARVAVLVKQAREAYVADEDPDTVAEIDAWLRARRAQ